MIQASRRRFLLGSVALAALVRAGAAPAFAERTLIVRSAGIGGVTTAGPAEVLALSGTYLDRLAILRRALAPYRYGRIVDETDAADGILLAAVLREPSPTPIA
jgi:hypothetical protein